MKVRRRAEKKGRRFMRTEDEKFKKGRGFVGSPGGTKEGSRRKERVEITEIKAAEEKERRRMERTEKTKYWRKEEDMAVTLLFKGERGK